MVSVSVTKKVLVSVMAADRAHHLCFELLLRMDFGSQCVISKSDVGVKQLDYQHEAKEHVRICSKPLALRQAFNVRNAPSPSG
jgi:hypothetical protein